MLSSSTGLQVYVVLFAQGLATTLVLGILTILFGGAFGAILGALRASNVRWVQQPIALYVEVVRSIPLLVFLFVAYYGLPIVLGVRSLSPLTSAGAPVDQKVVVFANMVSGRPARESATALR